MRRIPQGFYWHCDAKIIKTAYYISNSCTYMFLTKYLLKCKCKLKVSVSQWKLRGLSLAVNEFLIRVSVDEYKCFPFQFQRSYLANRLGRGTDNVVHVMALISYANGALGRLPQSYRNGPLSGISLFWYDTGDSGICTVLQIKGTQGNILGH